MSNLYQQIALENSWEFGVWMTLVIVSLFLCVLHLGVLFRAKEKTTGLKLDDIYARSRALGISLHCLTGIMALVVGWLAWSSMVAANMEKVETAINQAVHEGFDINATDDGRYVIQPHSRDPSKALI